MKRVGAVALGLAVTACSSSSVYGTVTGSSGRHTSGTVAAASSGSGGGTTGGATSSGSTGTVGGSTGSTSGTPTCEPFDPSSPYTGCDAGFEYRTRLVTGFGNDLSPLNMNIQISDDLSDFTTDTDACGNFVACFQPGQTRALLIESTAGYEPTLFGDLMLTANVTQDQIVIVPDAIIESITTGVQDFNQEDNELVIVANEILPGIGCPIQGWTFQLFLPDGGLASAAFNFPSGTGASDATSTTTFGLALAYNIDPSVTELTVVGYNDAGAPDGGACTYDGQFRGLTGLTHLKDGYVSFAPYILP